jgi:predicted ester cyclase
MSTEDLKALSRRWFEEVWNKGRSSAIDEMFHPTGVSHGLSQGAALVGPSAFRRFYDLMRSAFPDVQVNVEDVLQENDQSAIRFSFTGTHTGDGFGVAATGRRVRGTGISIIRWKRGQIVEAWDEFDAAGLIGQLQTPPPMRVKA